MVDKRWIPFALVLLGMTLSQTPERSRAEEVVHRSGARWSWPGQDRAGDYLRTEERALLERASSLQIPGTSGGYDSDLRLLERLGSYVWVVRDDQIDVLLRSHLEKIRGSREFREVLRSVALDSGMFNILERFLRSGGTLSQSSTGGRYTPEPLQILATIQNSAARLTGKTLFHELLHSYFDRTDSPLWEIKTGGGADHFAIQALEDRYLISQAFLFEGNLLDRNIEGLHGFLRAGELAPTLEPLIHSRNIDEIRRAVERVGGPEFYSHWVQTGMVTPLSSREYAHQNPGSQSERFLEAWTDPRLEDLAFLHAWNAQAFAIGIESAATVAIHQGQSISTAAKSIASRRLFQERLRSWISHLETSTQEGPRQAKERTQSPSRPRTGSP